MLVHMLRLQARVKFSEAVASVLRSMMMMMMMGKCIAYEQQSSQDSHDITPVVFLGVHVPRDGVNREDFQHYDMMTVLHGCRF